MSRNRFLGMLEVDLWWSFDGLCLLHTVVFTACSLMVNKYGIVDTYFIQNVRVQCSRRNRSHCWCWLGFAPSKHSKSGNVGPLVNWNKTSRFAICHPGNTTNTGWLQESCLKTLQNCLLQTWTWLAEEIKQFTHDHTSMYETHGTEELNFVNWPHHLLPLRTPEKKHGTHLPPRFQL